jgi:hypothetical protein
LSLVMAPPWNETSTITGADGGNPTASASALGNPQAIRLGTRMASPCHSALPSLAKASRWSAIGLRLPDAAFHWSRVTALARPKMGFSTILTSTKS